MSSCFASESSLADCRSFNLLDLFSPNSPYVLFSDFFLINTLVGVLRTLSYDLFPSSSFILHFCLTISLLSPLCHVWLPLSSLVQSLDSGLNHSIERTAELVPCLMDLASRYSSHPLTGRRTARFLSSSLTWQMLNPQSMYLLNFNKAVLGRDLSLAR